MDVENNNQEPEVNSKKDDFFDDEPPKQQAESTELVNGDVHEGESEGNTGEDAQDQEAVAASAGESNDAEPASMNGEPEPEGDGAADPVVAENGEEQPDEGFQSTSPQAASDVLTTEQEGDEQDGELEQQKEEDTPDTPKELEGNAVEEEAEPSKTDETQEAVPDVVVVTEEETQQEEEEVKADQEPEEVRNEQEQEADKQEADDKYDDDKFSEHSLASVDSGGKTMNQKIEIQEQQTTEEEGRDPTPVSQGGEASRSPTPSRSDSRAETADTVDPAPLPPEEPAKLDDRSSLSDVKENGEYRGEDRMDVSQPEGTEDSRGIGQWKTAEQQYIASAVLAQKSEREALKEVEEERDKLVEDKTTLQVKDLQERLAVLAREGEEKDKRINSLENELRSTKGLLHQKEGQLEEEKTKYAKALAAASAGGGDAPKSKTCILM